MTLLWPIASAPPVAAATGDITTEMGVGYLGDGGPAKIASLRGPSAVTLDPTGALVIADYDDGNVRRVDAAGTITTIAGDGSIDAVSGRVPPPADSLNRVGANGDGGSATEAAVPHPDGVAYDRAGNLYISEYANNRVRKVDVHGQISTLAGYGNPNPYGCGSTSKGAVALDDGHPATLACLHSPEGLAVDSAGNVYIADSLNYRVRRVDGSGVITTVAGGGTCNTSATANTYCGDGGPATAASLEPVALVFDSAGDLYIADQENCVIRVVDTSGIIHTFAGTGACSSTGDGGDARLATFEQPNGMAMDQNAMYISEATRVRRIDLATHRVSGAAGGVKGWSPDGVSGDATRFGSYPQGIAADQHGGLFIADPGNNRVVRYDSASHTTTTTAGTQDACPAQADVSAVRWRLCSPSGMAADTHGGIYVIDASNISDRVWRIRPDGTATPVAGSVPTKDGSCPLPKDGQPATSATLCPMGIAVDPAGNVYISDSSNTVLRVDARTGLISTVAGTGAAGYAGDGGPATSAQLDEPRGLAVGVGGELYIAESGNGSVRRVARDGTITTVAGDCSGATSLAPDGIGRSACGDGAGAADDGMPAVGAHMIPTALAIDGAGNLVIADNGNNRVVTVTNGTLHTLAGLDTPLGGYAGDGGPATNALLNDPQGVAFDPSDGSLYISDTGNNRIRRVDAKGIITTVVGNGTGGFCGDGGAATAACLSTPEGIVVTRHQLHIADEVNQRIRRVVLSGSGANDAAAHTARSDSATAQSAVTVGMRRLAAEVARRLHAVRLTA